MSANTKAVSLAPVALATAMLLAYGVVSTGHANEQVRSETVKFQDLNLTSASGVQALYDRIHAAARRVCSDNDPLQRFAASACARKAEARAVAEVNLPQLTAFYQQKTGAQSPLIANR